MTWGSVEGLPYPLGVSWSVEDDACNFAVYSKHATSVRLLVFGDDLVHAMCERVLDPLVNKSGRVWHCRLPAAALRDARFYGYVVDGPEPLGPFEAHAFHPEKLLLDPYARSIYFPPTFDRAAALDGVTNIGRAPLGVFDVQSQPYPWRDHRLARHESDAIIYELHVRGFTHHASSGVSEAARGTFAGVIEKIPYLRELGVTIVELMPVFQLDPQAGDYWGYMPMSFFAPNVGYAVGDAVHAFREMVDALHAAGIEVVLDAVYNHTAEAGANGPIYNFKGLDNSTYYLMKGDAPTDYADYSGCGNSVNANNRHVRTMILDSMRYWVNEMHVDGFRFDLASVFTRNPGRFAQLRRSADLRRYLVGPVLRSATNDRRALGRRWRLRARACVSGNDMATVEQPVSRRHAPLCSRRRRFDSARRCSASTAAMTSSRTMSSTPTTPIRASITSRVTTASRSTTCSRTSTSTTRPTVTATSMAPAQSFSTNSGWEGDTGVPDDVVALRERQAKNLIALLLLSNGTPMLRAGDEFLWSQGGNNNPYNQDNETSWLDWSRLDRHRRFFRFVQQMIAFRKRHPSLARSRFWRDDVRWFGPRGVVDLSASSHELALCVRGSSLRDDDLYIMINAGLDDACFVIQDISDRPWRLAVDTAATSPDDIDVTAGEALPHSSFVVRAHTVVVLVRA